MPKTAPSPNIQTWSEGRATYTLNRIARCLVVDTLSDDLKTLSTEVFEYSWSEETPRGLRLYQDFAPFSCLTIKVPIPQ